MLYIAKHFVIIIVGSLFTVTISCARQNNATEDDAPITENSQAPVDTKAIESYWTKERMDEAKPVPVPTTPPPNNHPRTPGAPQSSEQLKE